MASSKGKARGRPEKKRIAERIPRPGIRSRVRPTRRKRANTPRRRQPYDSVSIPQLVYELLTIDKYNQDAKGTSPERRFETPYRRTRSYYERPGLPYETMVGRRDSPESVQVPEYATESRPTSVESLTTEVTDAANSSAPTSSANSSVSNVSREPIMLANSLNSARTLFKKRSLMQLINNYIKAGIEEGKRRAKKYIRKALSFGVRSGYLIPTDPRGNVLRVCPTLTSFQRADAESRRKRRVARRGGTRLTTIDDRRAMRRGIPRGGSRRGAAAAAAAAKTTRSSKRRYRRQAAESPARSMSMSTRESSPRKSPDRSTLREKKKSKARKKEIDDKTNGKRRQQRKRNDGEDVKKPAKRRRISSSPKHVEDNYEPMEECCSSAIAGDRDRYESNEDNYRSITERWKSTSSREDGGSRMEKQKPVMSVDDDADRDADRDAVRRNDDEKSEEASVERDTTREMADA